MQAERGNSTGRDFAGLISEADRALRMARRNRHSLTGAGYYAKAFWQKVGEVRNEGERVALELERRGYAQEAGLVRAVLRELSPGEIGFAEAKSRLDGTRRAWYTTIGYNVQTRPDRKRIVSHYLAPELRDHLPGALRGVFNQIQGCCAFEFWDAGLVMLRK